MNRLIKSRFLIAAGAGVMLAASFPNFGVAGFAWLAPGLIVAAGVGLPSGERFRVGFVAGLAHYLASLNWLLLIPYRWHGIPLAPTTGWLALSAFMSMYMGLWVWIVSAGLQPGGSNAPPGTSPWKLISEVPWWQRAQLALLAAVVWVGIEMMIARFLSGFPWNLLGSSQFKLIPLLQVSSITGVYGVSFLLVWFSVALTCAVSRIMHVPKKAGWTSDLILPLLAISIVFVLGYRSVVRYDKTASTGPVLRAALVQPSIPQTLIWDQANDELRFQELLRLSQESISEPADLVIWPEAAVPKLVRYDEDTFAAITDFARTNQVWMIIGADDAEPRNETDRRTGKPIMDYYNSSFLIGPTGRLMESYKKRALVIFGEYVPLSDWLSFLKFFTPIEGGFTPGKRPVPFRLTDPKVETSVLICFEDVFPHLAREYVTEDTAFLVNLTNNGWFGEGSAQWQHAASALFRAIENGCSLVRCSNNGLTCWVDPCGRLRGVFRDANSKIYGKGSLRISIPVQDRAPGATFYNRHGDVFGWGCAGISILALLRRVIPGRKES